tara:strand:- start:238 stop:519 length:282 start_codon:yes stop_codon:yes gene_type:complete
MTNKAQRTSVGNAHLKNVLKLIDTYQFKIENCEWQGETGTYQAIKKAGEHFRCEMAKQTRQTRRTMNIEVVVDPERQEFLRQHFEQNLDIGEK